MNPTICDHPIEAQEIGKEFYGDLHDQLICQLCGKGLGNGGFLGEVGGGGVAAAWHKWIEARRLARLRGGRGEVKPDGQS